MRLSKLSELKSIETEKIFNDLTNELTPFSHEPVYATYSTAYVIAKADTTESNSMASLDSFISCYVNDENIKKFLEFSLNGTWDIVKKVQNRYDKNSLIALLIFNNSYQMKCLSDCTPSQLSRLACEILDIQDNDTVGDYCTGYGSFIVEALQFNENAQYYGNEINEYKAGVALMRRDILQKNIIIEEKDTFLIDTDKTKFDKIFSNHPFALRIGDNDSFGASARQILNSYLPERKKTISSDWLFGTVIVNTMTENGKAVAVMTTGSLFNNRDMDIRRYYVENGLIESVIALPSRLFENSAISTNLVVFSHGNSSTKFIDASKCCIEKRRLNIISDNNIKEILNLLETETDNSKTVTTDEIREKDFTLDVFGYLHNELQTENIKNSVKFGDIIKSVTRGSQLKASELDKLVSETPTQYRYLTPSDVQNGTISSSLIYIKKIDDNLNKYCVHDKNLIISKIGRPIKIAVVRINEDIKVLASGNLYIVEIDKAKANPYFIKAFFESQMGAEILNKSASGTAMPTISLEALKNVSVPCPSLETQNRIANKYIEAMKELENAKKQVEKIEEKIKNVYDDNVNN